jgi:hypothetical protein
MEKQRNNPLVSTRPKDKSLEAYKAWMRELIERFTTPSTQIEFTEKEWRENWQEYWKEHSKIT